MASAMERRFRLLEPLKRKQGRTVVVVVDGHFGLQFNGPADQFQGFFMPAPLLANNAVEMKRAGMVWLPLEDAAVELLCVAKTTFAVNPDGGVDG